MNTQTAEVQSHSTGQPEPQRTVDLAGKSPEEKEFIEKVADRVPEPAKSEPKEKQSTEGKPQDKPGDDSQHDGKTEAGEKPAKDQSATQGQRPLSGYDRVLERASKEQEDFDGFVEKMQAPIFPNSQEGYARYQVLSHAMNQCANQEDVAYHLATNPTLLLEMNECEPWKIGTLVHKVSAKLRFGGAKPKEGPRPRAPRPPSEVGGRGAAMGDPAAEAARDGNFSAFEAAMNSRYRR